ncbi:cyanophycinase [Pontibacter sp. KCTC 32443]|uniref:cyanophycinase n=1 Tax=Pontibacter TaxID=323449 RepID=UPI00164D0EFC|nr:MULTISPECIES: cyanophycinase [Pontibacter]MBC5772671.1 cyanophycinase [Pontibacter sp. KCTC 32443]
MAKKKVNISSNSKDKNTSALPFPKGKLLAIGGKESKGEEEQEQTEVQRLSIDFISQEILKRFVEELKGDNPLVAVIPTASGEPEESAKSYVDVFTDLGVKDVQVIDIRNRVDAQKEENCDIISRAAGVMFTGGDQLKLTAILGGTRFLEKIKERYTYDDFIIAGTSAGAAALSTPMIYEGETNKGMLKGDVRITTGLEFLKNIAIDTHFIQRGRIIRMAQCIATNPGCIGIGLEEDTAIFVTNGKNVEVVGTGLVTVVDGMNITKSTIHEIKTGQPFSVCGLEVHLMADKETFIIPTFEQLHA